jgi:hypothetical protein
MSLSSAQAADTSNSNKSPADSLPAIIPASSKSPALCGYPRACAGLPRALTFFKKSNGVGRGCARGDNELHRFVERPIGG